MVSTPAGETMISQILAFMPIAIQTALNGTEGDVVSVAIDPYTTVGTGADGSGTQALWAGLIPESAVASLQAQLQVANSALFTQQSQVVARQLVSQIDRTMPLIVSSSLSTITGAGSGAAAGSAPGDAAAASASADEADKRRTTIIAVVCSFAGVLAILLAFLALRAYRRRASNGPIHLPTSAGGPQSPYMRELHLSNGGTESQYASVRDRSPRSSTGSSAIDPFTDNHSPGLTPPPFLAAHEDRRPSGPRHRPRQVARTPPQQVHQSTTCVL